MPLTASRTLRAARRNRDAAAFARPRRLRQQPRPAGLSATPNGAGHVPRDQVVRRPRGRQRSGSWTATPREEGDEHRGQGLVALRRLRRWPDDLAARTGTMLGLLQQRRPGRPRRYDPGHPAAPDGTRPVSTDMTSVRDAHRTAAHRPDRAVTSVGQQPQRTQQPDHDRPATTTSPGRRRAHAGQPARQQLQRRGTAAVNISSGMRRGSISRPIGGQGLLPRQPHRPGPPKPARCAPDPGAGR